MTGLVANIVPLILALLGSGSGATLSSMSPIFACVGSVGAGVRGEGGREGEGGAGGWMGRAAVGGNDHSRSSDRSMCAILSVSRSCRMLRYSIDAPTRPHDWASAAASRRSWLCSVMCVKLSRAAGSAARAPGKWHHEGGALRRRRAAHRGRSESMAGPSSNFLESVLLR